MPLNREELDKGKQLYTTYTAEKGYYTKMALEQALEDWLTDHVQDLLACAEVVLGVQGHDPELIRINSMIPDWLATLLNDSGGTYTNPTLMKDGRWAVLTRQAYTIGVTVIDQSSVIVRFCYKDYQDAKVALEGWAKEGGDYPDGPWIKAKGTWKHQHVDCGPSDLGHNGAWNHEI